MALLKDRIPHPHRAEASFRPIIHEDLPTVDVVHRSPIETFFASNINWLGIGFKFGCGFAMGVAVLSLAIYSTADLRFTVEK